MILVTGATGHFGNKVIEFLLKKGVPASGIAAMVRDEAKADALKSTGIELRKGDYNNYESLLNAFTGIDKLLFVSGTDIQHRSRQHADIVKAAREAGVKQVVYTSFERKNETGTSPIAFVAASHLETEELLKKSGLAYTILRNNIYLEMLPIFFGEKVLQTGVFFPAGDAPAGLASREDMAEATAQILTSADHENKEYFFSNPENVSFKQISHILGGITGKNISYTSPEAAVYIDTLTGAGVPAAYIGMFAGFAEAFKQGEFTQSKTDLEYLLGRKPVTVAEYLSKVYTNAN